MSTVFPKNFFQRSLKGTVQPLAEVLGFLELVEHPFDEPRAIEMLVVDFLHQQPVALLEELGIGMILGIAVGHPLQGAVSVPGETLGVFDGLLQRRPVVEDLLAEAFQGLGKGHVHPRTEHVAAEVVFRLTRLHLKVIAAEHRLLAAFANKHTEMGLVRPLVGRETGVAIKAIGAVFEGQPLHVGVELSHARDDLLGEDVELGLGALVFLLVLMEPLAVVVVEHVGEKGDDFFHILLFLMEQR